MLAKSLTDKLIGLLKYEIISITTIKGSNTIGTPLGTNNFKYPNPCLIKPIIVTPIKINAAKNKSYNYMTSNSKSIGNHSKHITKNTNMNKENIKEKYGLAFDPAVSLIIFETKV